MTWDEIEELACLMLGKDYNGLLNNFYLLIPITVNAYNQKGT